MTAIRCAGWWEQSGYGRQPMNNLQLVYTDLHFVGSGSDCVGVFELRGEIEGTSVSIMKQYVDAHQVLYAGAVDGEGTMTGMWSISGVGGRWLIKVESVIDASDDIQTIVPG
ncbi:MAG: hypothetical protein NXI04_07655 [Planctomycetaceae bacterium]|nr:hypothetical protein [Planctomycetaceae bacterium]